jgi:hypothetical protein
MGLLDDAIREHLDLKRRSGADPTEIERLEREALGPVRREPLIAEEPLVAHEPLVADAPHLAEEPAAAPEPEPEPERRSFFRRRAPEPEPAAPPPLELGHSAHGDDLEPWDEEEDEYDDEYEVQPAAEAPPVSPPPVAPPPPAASEIPPPVAAFPPAPAPPAPAAEPGPEPPTPAPRPADSALGETVEYDVERAMREEAGDREDVLEETPEFLQDTPDHDRLWFEQKPPRDFDFDG